MYVHLLHIYIFYTLSEHISCVQICIRDVCDNKRTSGCWMCTRLVGVLLEQIHSSETASVPANTVAGRHERSHITQTRLPRGKHFLCNTLMEAFLASCCVTNWVPKALAPNRNVGNYYAMCSISHRVAGQAPECFKQLQYTHCPLSCSLPCSQVTSFVWAKKNTKGMSGIQGMQEHIQVWCWVGRRLSQSTKKWRVFLRITCFSPWDKQTLVFIAFHLMPTVWRVQFLWMSRLCLLSSVLLSPLMSVTLFLQASLSLPLSFLPLSLSSCAYCMYCGVTKVHE